MSYETELKDVEPEAIEQLAGYLCTAWTSVNVGNVQSLLLVATLYQYDPVKTMCLDFLRERINTTYYKLPGYISPGRFDQLS